MKNCKYSTRQGLLRPAVWFMATMMGLAGCAAAQIEQNGQVFGNYKLQQTIEVGGRVTDASGNGSTYNTLVNLHDGLRVLDQSLYMRSLKHSSNALVDELYLNSFGYGGDPAAGSRLRMSKNRWYDLKADFRTSKYWWDYNTIDQPFNSTGGTFVWDRSLHAQYLRRNMGGFDLTLAPQHKFSLRLGYTGTSTSGEADSTLHQYGDHPITRRGESRQDEYRAGLDWKLADRTFLRIDQAFAHNRQDYTWTASYVSAYAVNTGASGAAAVLGTGVLNPGYTYDPNYGYPCSSVLSGGVLQVAKCSSAYGALLSSYNNRQPSTTNIPATELSFTSNYWEKLDISASAAYTDAISRVRSYGDSAVPYYLPSTVKAALQSGPETIHQKTASAELGVTYHIDDAWSVTQEFRFLRWRIPAEALLTTTTCFANANIRTPTDYVTAGIGSPNGTTTCGTLAATGSAYAGTNTTADLSADGVYRFLGERELEEKTSLNWEPSRRVAVHIGYKYGDRSLNTESMDTTTSTTYADNSSSRTAGTVVAVTTPDTRDEKSLHEHTLLMGTELRPAKDWRLNMNYDMTYASNNFVATTPKEVHKFKLRTTYSLEKYGKLAASVNLTDRRNDSVASIGGVAVFPAGVTSPKHEDYTRYYSLSYTAQPLHGTSIDLGWTYNDLYSKSGTCMPLTAGVVPEDGTITTSTPYGYAGCVYSGVAQTSILPVVLKYRQITNTAYVKVQWRPIRQLLLMGGYDLNSGQGYDLWTRADNGAALLVPVDATGLNVVTSTTGTASGYVLGPNPRLPLGSLNTIWHRPMAGVEYAFTRQISFRGIFNNYLYHDKAPAGTLVVPREFRVNTGTLSLLYSF